jgi:hypothetical protein
MLQEFSYYPVFGRPVILYLGLITICLFLATALIPLLSQRGVMKIPLSWHARMAFLSICFALVHGVLGAAAYF